MHQFFIIPDIEALACVR